MSLWVGWTCARRRLTDGARSSKRCPPRLCRTDCLPIRQPSARMNPATRPKSYQFDAISSSSAARPSRADSGWLVVGTPAGWIEKVLVASKIATTDQRFLTGNADERSTLAVEELGMALERCRSQPGQATVEVHRRIARKTVNSMASRSMEVDLGPGARWSTDLKPDVGPSSASTDVALVLSGTLPRRDARPIRPGVQSPRRHDDPSRP